jgi:hypothetical protein
MDLRKTATIQLRIQLKLRLRNGMEMDRRLQHRMGTVLKIDNMLLALLPNRHLRIRMGIFRLDKILGMLVHADLTAMVQPQLLKMVKMVKMVKMGIMYRADLTIKVSNHRHLINSNP